MYVKDHMTKNPYTITKDVVISKAVEIMRKNHFHRLPVVDDQGKLIGLVTGGLVKDDFVTWDEEKYAFVSEVLWKTSDGKPIGLDHEIALGANGVSLGTISGSVDPIDPTVTPEPSEETEVTDETEVSTEDTKVSDETTVSVSVETETEEETSSDEVSKKKADNKLQLSALGNILKVVVVIAIIIAVALIVFVVTRVIVLKRKGQSFKEILVNLFKLF